MTLTPVPFKKGRAHASRISPARVPGRRSLRFWTAAENDILRRYYPEGGIIACGAHLPAHHSSRSSIYAQAWKLGLRKAKGRGSGKHGKRALPADLDARIAKAWPQLDGKKRGAVNMLADRLGVPRWIVSKRAHVLGLQIQHKKEPPWTKAEEALMAKIPLHDLDRAARVFKQHGFQRSAVAIGVRAKRLNISRRFKEGLAATDAAKILGFDNKTMSTYCVAGDCKAARRGDRRAPQQGGARWIIRPADLRQFVIDHLGRIDLRKVDKFAFVRLLITEGAASKLRGWTAAEDDIVRDGYRRKRKVIEIIDELEAAGFRRRVGGGISQRAQHLGFASRATYWCAEEDRIVKAGYADKSVKIVEIIDHLAAAGFTRSRTSIQMRAIELRLTRDRVNYWTEPEKRIALAGLRAGKTHGAIRDELAAAGYIRGPTSMFKFAQKHRIVRKAQPWTPAQVAILRARYAAKVPPKEISRELGKTVSAIRTLASTLGLKQRVPFSAEEVDYLTEASADGVRLTAAAKWLGRSYVSISRMASSLGLDFRPGRSNGKATHA